MRYLFRAFSVQPYSNLIAVTGSRRLALRDGYIPETTPMVTVKRRSRRILDDMGVPGDFNAQRAF